MPTLNINTDEVVIWTNKLEKMHRSALPVAIRESLNRAAFDVKGTSKGGEGTMLKTSKSAFVNRSTNFFKANSMVEKAKGFNTKSMQAMVGFTSAKLKGGDNFAVKDLEQQERGGKIGGKSFIPSDEARGGNSAKAVRPRNRLSKITKIIDARKGKGKSDGSKFHRAANKAGRGGHVLAKFKGKMNLWRVNSLNKTKEGAWKLTHLYTVDKDRKVSVSGTGFMRIASLKSGGKIERFYIKEAEKQIKRLKG